MELCVAIGGTITGEHGVGSEKRSYMRLMFNEDELRVMQDIKDVFDPEAILNPGKIVPELGPVEPRAAARAVVPADGEWTPKSTEEAAEGLRQLCEEGRSVRILGGGTKSAALPQADVTLSTQALCGVKAFELNDLFVTAGAGATLAELQAFLTERGVWAPLASPWPEATVGGIVASNFNAPLRMRYGAIRDLLLAMTVVMPDGRVIRAGKPVVKNVAGYDLPKLHTGAQGTLGLITDVSFKLLPLPRSRETLVIPAGALADALNLGQRLLRVCLVSTALLLVKGRSVDGIPAPYALLYTAEGVPEDTQAELAEARALVPSEGAISIEGLAGSDVWADWIRDAGGAPVVRAGVAPKDLPRLLIDAAPALGDAPFIADLASGLVYTRGLPAGALRGAATRLGGYAAVVAGPAGEEPQWGYAADGLDLMLGLKRKWDPAGLFNPGAFA
ncbi:MAG: FAD-binding protein [Anaerolineae bacterium]|nr:FAD-binding protein [Anaerolineae bacterium]